MGGKDGGEPVDTVEELESVEKKEKGLVEVITTNVIFVMYRIYIS